MLDTNSRPICHVTTAHIYDNILLRFSANEAILVLLSQVSCYTKHGTV